MNTRTTFFALGTALAIGAALTLATGGCGDDGPTGNNSLDPTLAINPCDSPSTSRVGLSGFIMAGSGYQGQLVRFDGAADVLLDGSAIGYSIKDTVALADDSDAIVVLDIHVPGAATTTYAFNDAVGEEASSVRVELRRGGTSPMVFRSVEGRIMFDSLVNRAQPFGRFCGTLQDSVSRARIAVMSGRFGIP